MKRELDILGLLFVRPVCRFEAYSPELLVSEKIGLSRLHKNKEEKEVKKKKKLEHEDTYAQAHIRGLRVDFLLKTDSGYPKDEGVALFTLATSENPLRYNTHRSAQPVSTLAYSRRPIPPLASRPLESNLQVWVIRKGISSKAAGGLTRQSCL